MAKKKRLTRDQEFDIMKLVLDKFLWLGFIIMGWGLIVILRDAVLTPGLWYVGAGAVVLVIFALLIIKEFEIIAR